jgi:hypothetical protein
MAVGLSFLTPASANLCEDILTITEPKLLRTIERLDAHSKHQWELATLSLGKILSVHISEWFRTLRLAGEENVLPAFKKAGFLNAYGGLREDNELPMAAIRLMQYFADQKQAALQSGLTEEDIIEPGFLFAHKSGKLIVLPFGARVPDGYSLQVQFPDLLDGKVFTEFLAEGYQTVQLSLDRDDAWMSFHDISHLFGYYAELDYMRASRMLAQAASSGDDITDSHSMANFYMFEIFTWVGKDALKEFEKRFGLQKLAECQETECFEDLLFEYGSPRADVWEYLRENMSALLRPLGGAILSRNAVTFVGDPAEESAPYFIARKWLTTGQIDLFVEFLYQMARTDIVHHAQVLRNGPSPEFCGFYYQFALKHRVWRRLCPTEF